MIDTIDKPSIGPIDPTHPTRPIRALLAVIGSVSSFALLIDTAGLIPAVIVTVLVASRGSRDTRAGEVLLFAACLALVLSVLFVIVLGQPFPLIGAW